jgi:hypothetical protein
MRWGEEEEEEEENKGEQRRRGRGEERRGEERRRAQGTNVGAPCDKQSRLYEMNAYTNALTVRSRYNGSEPTAQ